MKRNRGLALSLKLLMPEHLWRWITKPIVLLLKGLPTNFLYSAGYKLRISKMPYNLIEDGDVVLQVGAPRDLLVVGRSRAVYFMKCAGSGVVVVFEPDPKSAEALLSFAIQHGLESRLILVKKGAWSKDDTLKFYSSPSYPAANLIEGACEITAEEKMRRNYQEILVPVTTIDIVLKQLRLKAFNFLSITANGSETEIIKGASNLITQVKPYISLAITGNNYPELMNTLGYGLGASGDRGFTFLLESGCN